MRDDGVDEVASEKLQADLRIADVDVEQHADQLLVEPGYTTPRRVVDLRARVALRADRGVERVALHRFEESGKLRRMQVEVGVDEPDVPAPRCEQSQLDGVALSDVPVVLQDPHFGMAGGKCPLGRVVDRPVGDDDQLVWDAGLREPRG